MAELTESEVLEMERQAAEYRQRQAEAAAQEQRAEAAEVIELVEGADFDAVKAQVEQILQSTPSTRDDIFPHLYAMNVGIKGIARFVDGLPPAPEQSDAIPQEATAA